jgi:hypothetical protein
MASDGDTGDVVFLVVDKVYDFIKIWYCAICAKPI